ncbi:hypothetical protein DSECCO2_569450 [anaerobic digester metagenome]
MATGTVRRREKQLYVWMYILSSLGGGCVNRLDVISEFFRSLIAIKNFHNTCPVFRMCTTGY